MMLKSHYETLGVAQSATTQEIKKAYRQLCLQTHPDVAGPGNTELFKEIAHAHDILSNPRQRQMYDRELIYRSTWGGNSNSSSGGYGRRYPNDLRSRSPYDFARRARASSSSSSAFSTMSVFGNGLSVPTVISLSLTLVAGWCLYTLTKDRSHAEFRPTRRASYRYAGGPDDVVEAWKNPNTGFWEQPAPWDPTYRRLQPKLELVPRRQVRQRSL